MNTPKEQMNNLSKQTEELIEQLAGEHQRGGYSWQAAKRT